MTPLQVKTLVICTIFVSFAGADVVAGADGLIADEDGHFLHDEGGGLTEHEIALNKAEEDGAKHPDEPYVATPEMLKRHEGQPLTANDEPVVEAHKYDWDAIDADEDTKHSAQEIRTFHLAEFKAQKPNLSDEEVTLQVDQLVAHVMTKDANQDGLLTREELHAEL
jgi:hypothetical protein